MEITEYAKSYHEKMFPDKKSIFGENDPEFTEIFYNFAFDEVVNSDDIDDKTRFTAILATLIGCQGIDAYKLMLPAALNAGVSPIEVKEIVYQSTPYLGMGRILPFLNATNEILHEQNTDLPLAKQSTTTAKSREESGEQAQI